jgi:magnesium-transporting ATPase (P-type)
MIVLSSTTLSYHANASKDEQIVKQLFRVVRKSGWNVPGANQSLVASDVQSISVDGETVTKKRLQTETELLTTEEFFYVKGDSQLQINSIPFALRGLYCYEFANKKFAYEARLVPVQVKDNDTRIYAGAMVILYYFDEDRDGIFETRYGNLSRIKLPEWIRKSESNK